ncbi:MAG: stressosome-associated protein Prli42 [Bacilli bacterium]
MKKNRMKIVVWVMLISMILSTLLAGMSLMF